MSSSTDGGGRHHGGARDATARGVAARVLERVWDEGAFASVALDAELGRADLPVRDAALATQLVYGVLRTQGWLDARLAELSARGATGPSDELRAPLFMAAYTIAFLDRVPARAAVSEAVAAVRAAVEARRGRAAADSLVGYANAVLRRFADETAGARPELADAVAASAPGWLRGALRRALGRAGARDFLAAGPVPPPLGLCVGAAEERATWSARIRAAAPDAEIREGAASPNALLLRGAGDPRRLPGLGEGWIVQEEGSQVVALALGARAGERVLDACAGHGNKSWLLGRAVGPTGAVDAADVAPAKLAQLARSGWPLGRTFAVDWSAGTGDVPAGYDRALVDAPCSGVGTLRRRPEIALRRTADDLQRLHALQVALARSVATRVKDGGRLVFSVCSVLREEADDVAAALAATAAPRLEAAPFDAAALRALAGPEATTLRLLPDAHGTDGYFVASFVVRHAAG